MCDPAEDSLYAGENVDCEFFLLFSLALLSGICNSLEILFYGALLDYCEPTRNEVLSSDELLFDGAGWIFSSQSSLSYVIIESLLTFFFFLPLFDGNL